MKLLICLAALLAAAAAVMKPDFRDVGRSYGFTHGIPNGGADSKQYIIETTGSGVALFDYDDDGFADAFVVSGDGAPSRLYHNEGGKKFTDVSEAFGIRRIGWGQGLCAGDYDNDGYTDLFVTYWGQNILYRNEAGHRFRDVTTEAGLQQDRTRYNTGCAFLDYDRDGRLDLFVANYLKFSFESTPKPGANPYCWYLGMPVNCGPRGLPFDSNILYHANSDRTFTDVSEQTGIMVPKQSYCLTALTGDFNDDGWPDIFVACDQTPSLLYINDQKGAFEEDAVLRGAAFNENGKAMSGMGASAADYNHSGHLSIFRTNFSDERETLYRNQGAAQFEDATSGAGMAQNTRFVGWGCAFFDYDNDGWKDLLLVNGHAFPEVDRRKLHVHYRERAILYRNSKNGAFEDVSERSGEGILARHSARGLAVADIDNDGRLEILINNQNEVPALLQQSSSVHGAWTSIRLVGSKSNRSAIGARVRLTSGGITQTDEVRSGGSYLSQSDLRLHFGLGSGKRIDSIEVRWPSGKISRSNNLPVNKLHVLREQ